MLVGTSGFSYPEWKPGFYPADLPAKKFLSYYAQRFHTTEINNTFYRIPKTTVCEGWYAEVPADFAFTLKLTQRVTHFKRLQNVDQEMTWFLGSALGLQEKLGCILVQLPPTLPKELDLLDAFLTKYASRARLAVEFRHDTWFADDTYDLLRRHDTAFAVVEHEEDDDAPVILATTASFVYMRLRKREYTDAEMRDWAQWIRAQEADVFCYLKHEERAPGLAKQLITALGARA